MPTIYSSIYNNFIRQGSTFAKSITSHSYAQSVVVAGTHLNSQNRPVFSRRRHGQFGRLQTLQSQASIHTSTTTSLGRSSDHRLERAVTLQNHGGLDAYFEALQKQQASGEAEKEWSQFQFPKRIEWKPTPASILVGDSQVAPSSAPHDGVATTSSECAIDDTDAYSQLNDVDDTITVELEEAASPRTPVQSRLASPIIPEPAQAEGHGIGESIVEPATSRAATPTPSRATPAELQSQSYADHLRRLSEAGRYAEIPPVFEAMLATAAQLVASSYNALLMAAIHLPTARTEAVSKALDVYADMLKRKIHPDSDTFNILVGLLASRSLEVSAQKQALNSKRVRFGGMDEPGKFMFASDELEHAILCEEDRLDLAMRLFDTSINANMCAYSSETYHQLIAACAQVGRITEMLRLFEHLELNKATPYAAVFPTMITAFASAGDLVSAIECYNEYKELAIANDNGESTLFERQDAEVYASVINAFIISDKLSGAMHFYEKIIKEYGVRAAEIKDAIIRGGFVKGFVQRGIYQEALRWAQAVEDETRAQTMAGVASKAADQGDAVVASTAFSQIRPGTHDIIDPSAALLAMSVRQGDVTAATRYWNVLKDPASPADSSFIEPTTMYAVALIGSGQVAEGLAQSESMFQRIKLSTDKTPVADELDEAVEFITRYMRARGIMDPRELVSPTNSLQPTSTNSPYTSSISSFEDSFDPYATNTDFKGSSLISDDLDGANSRRGPRLHDALNRFRNVRRAGRHLRYITYSKLISAAAREGKMDLCNDILATAKTDVPLLPQYASVRYGWSSILDAMVGACLTSGNRQLAEQYHQELLDIGATPSANTFGLYITTLKESTRTFDEASEAVRIFHRAKAEGVEPSSFLYNALIGKLGKARRIDDCLFYFGEMRGLGIKPTSVTYGTIVNALCRVSDEKFAEELFDEMEGMPNYKPRPAPYNSMMQFFLTTKRDKAKVLAYHQRMKTKGIAPTSHTYKLLIDTHATLEPIDMAAAEGILDSIRSAGMRAEPVHFASLIHARGCSLHDMEGARKIFDGVLNDSAVSPNASIFQALLEAMVANHRVTETGRITDMMKQRNVGLTAYIANTLIHGWASENVINKARSIYDAVDREHREPSTYEAMTRAYLAVEEREGAKEVVGEMLGRGYPSAVVNKVLELLSGGPEAKTE